MDIPVTVKFLSITIDDLDILQSAYMPFLRRGGLFLPSATLNRHTQAFQANCRLHVEYCLLLRIMNELEARCCTARVAWISPVKQSDQRCAGVGLEFDKNGASIKAALESLLAQGGHKALRSQTL